MSLEEKSIKESEWTLDSKFKELFRKKKFLSPILKNIIPEYADLDLYEIEGLIRTDAFVSVNAEVAGTEDHSGDGKIFYDVIVYCRLQGTESEIAVDIVFDLEMQRKNYPGYPIVKRGIYYCSRLISRQIEKVTDEAYRNLKPVYSVWIIVNDIPKKLQNSRYTVCLQYNVPYKVDTARKRDYLKC